MKLLYRLLTSVFIFMVLNSSLSAQQYFERNYEADPDTQEKATALMTSTEAFVGWLDGERSNRGWASYPQKQEICSKAAEALSNDDAKEIWLSLLIEQKQVLRNDAGLIKIDDVVSPYHYTLVVREACESGNFFIGDLRDHRLDNTLDGKNSTYAANCPTGPKLTLDERTAKITIYTLNAFKQFNNVRFSCLGSEHGYAGHIPWTELWNAIEVKAEEFTLSNTRFQSFLIQNSEIGTLTVEGTIPPPADRPPESPDLRDDDAVARAFPGTLAQSFFSVKNAIKSLRVRGVAIGTFSILSTSIQNDSTISRSEFGALLISDSKLSEVTLFQLRLTAKGEGNSYSRNGVGLHLPNNEISGDLHIGSLGKTHEAMAGSTYTTPQFAQQIREVFDSMLGPKPSWVAEGAWNSAAIEVRGYITLANNRIGGQFKISGLDLADGVGTTDSPNYAFLNLNGVSARSFELLDNQIILSEGRSILGKDIRVERDVEIADNFIHRQIDGFKRDYRPNRHILQWNKNVSSSSGAAYLMGFSGIQSRDIVFRQNLIDGVILLDNARARDVRFYTFSPDSENGTFNGAEFCWKPVAPTTFDFVSAARLQGGLWVGWNRHLPFSEKLVPTCYGSIVVAGGTIDVIETRALVSDLLFLNARILQRVSLGGRVTGIVNLGNLQLREGPLEFGSTGQPLRWCQSSELSLDGVRLWALQADRESLDRYDCESETVLPQPDSKKGIVNISARGAHIEKISGLTRVNLSQPVDAGFLALSSERLQAIFAPPLDSGPLYSRVNAIVSYWLGQQAPRREISNDGIGLDPQAVAQFAKILKENGYTSKATDLTIARIDRQKWESGDRLDRVKWLLGWPISWGYQVEWGFAYGAGFLIVGAWVSAYYRERPDRSPPLPPWPKLPARFARIVPGFPIRLTIPGISGRHRSVVISIARLQIKLLAIAMTILAFLVWLPHPAMLTPGETFVLSITLLAGSLALVGVIIGRSMLMSGARRRRAYALRRRAFLTASRGIFTPHALFFSLDRFLPAPGLHAYWGNYPRIGQAGRNYFYFHRLMGLLLVSIIAAGFVGLFD